MIDIRWIKNSKTKKSGLKLVERKSWHDYPSGTATVEIVGVTKKNPEIRVHFYFDSKSDKGMFWDATIKKTTLQDFKWTLNCVATMTFNEFENDYNYYFNFPNGKNCTMNDKELMQMVETLHTIKRDLKNILTLHNFNENI